MEDKNGYFEAALSDFVFDVAAGGAIRHLVDRGHSVDQITKELDYPVPRAKVEKAVFRYMSESEILTAMLPNMNTDKIISINFLKGSDIRMFCERLDENIKKYGVQNSYMECPFGNWIKNDESRLQQVMSCLNSREKEYILGIKWEQNVMYHRLNERMREIAVKLASHTNEEWKFYFVSHNTDND